MTLDLPNGKSPSDRLVTGGQPSEAQLRQAKAAGIDTVVNLRMPGEYGDFDEAALARQLGLAYVAIPVGGMADINRANAEKLDRALAAGGSVLVHCASGNRVGALLACRACLIQGESPERAMAIGAAAGLDERGPLCGTVRTLLQQQAGA